MKTSAIKWFQENWFKLGLLVMGFIIAIAFWHYLVVLPKERELRTELEEIKKSAEKDLKKEELNSCLEDAEYTYLQYWNSQCKSQGEKPDCFLPKYNADSAEKLKQQEKDNCFQAQ